MFISLYDFSQESLLAVENPFMMLSSLGFLFGEVPWVSYMCGRLVLSPLHDSMYIFLRKIFGCVNYIQINKKLNIKSYVYYANFSSLYQI
jgi:hypothetical protein